MGAALRISHDRQSRLRRSPFLVDACFERRIGGITPERKNAGSGYCEQNSGDRETSVVTARKLVDIGESHRPNPAGDRDTCKNETVSSGVILQNKITRGQERQQIEFGPGGQIDQRRCQYGETDRLLSVIMRHPIVAGVRITAATPGAQKRSISQPIATLPRMTEMPKALVASNADCGAMPLSVSAGMKR